jgi:FkbM family methyltransferase
VFIPVSELQSDWNLSVGSVLHVGAHTGEEASQYEDADWAPIIWIEAQPDLVRDLREKLDPRRHTIIEAAIYDENGIALSLHISSNSQSSSLLNFGTHGQDYPEIFMTKDLAVSTKRLDSLIEKKDIPNFINLDIQGVELKALQGLGNLISDVKYIYTEVNRFDVYEGCATVHEIDFFLSSKGFSRVTTRWQWLEGWGDALYIRKNEAYQSQIQRVRSFIRLIYFYKPQSKKLLRTLVLHPKYFFSKKK